MAYILKLFEKPRNTTETQWTHRNNGATLIWRDVCVYTKCNESSDFRDIKRIINNSSGAVQPGSLMALMGSSGSGKTTLMSALAYRQQAGTIVQGDILLNGNQIGPFMNQLSGFVYQDDVFLDSLTVSEHMNFMAHLQLDARINKHEREKIIFDLLRSTGLNSQAATKIGSDGGNNVLSGGERKRLAFAVELLKNPMILFCDEPTTGLDSFSAQHIIQTLFNLAQAGTTIICTIHQPSSQLFDMFNYVLLLADGRVAFAGSPENALQFFSANGYLCPETYNPADFLIGVLASDSSYEDSSNQSSQYLCDLFAVSTAAKQRDMLVNLEIHMSRMNEHRLNIQNCSFKRVPWYKKLYIIWKRAVLVIIRNPKMQCFRLLQKMLIAFIIGICFAGSTNLTQKGVQAVEGIIFIMISENTFHPMYSVLNDFPQILPLFVRESNSGIYSTSVFYAANILAMVPLTVAEPFIFVAIAYWLAGLRATFFAYIITSICIILVLNVATACGFMFSTAFKSVPQAMAFLVPVDYIFMITSGIFLKLSSIPAAFSWTQYLSWMKYANEAVTIVQWSGIQNITCYQPDLKLPCLQTGQDVLNKYSFEEQNLINCLIGMIAIYFGFHIISCYFLRSSLRK